jgi:hypothetical protein
VKYCLVDLRNIIPADKARFDRIEHSVCVIYLMLRKVEGLREVRALTRYSHLFASCLYLWSTCQMSALRDVRKSIS